MSHTTAATSRRKKTRTAHACEECRQRKRRCDGNYPCRCCKEGLLVCRYAEILPPKVDRMFIELNRSIERLSQHQEVLISRIAVLEASLDNSVTRISLSQHRSQHISTAHDTSKFLLLVQPSIQHNTGPHELLHRWPSLLSLLQSANLDIDSNYVSRLEGCKSSRRCVCRPLVMLCDESLLHSPRLFPTAGTQPDDRSQAQPYLTAATIRTLCVQYERHLHLLHPFLDKPELGIICDNFINWRASQLSEYNRPVGHRHTSHLNDDLKSQSTSKLPIGSCLEHALMYAVLALGRIVAHKEPLTAKSNDCDSHMTAIRIDSRYGISDLQDYRRETREASHSTAALSPSDITWAESLTGSTLAGTSPLSSDSQDEMPYACSSTTPGSDEYATAELTLEICQHGDDLLLAQIYLLMGLYNGQLALVTESMKCYAQAGRLLLLLLDRYNLHADSPSPQDGVEHRYHQTQARIKDKRHNLIVLASWTCMQLESDILANLHLPSTGMQSVQHLLPLPLDPSDLNKHNGRPHTKIPEVYEDRGDLMIHFTAQSFLQKRLNIAHTQLYSSECSDHSLTEIQGILAGHQNILVSWRNQLPQSLKWSDSGPPSSDIFSARLQAKYWKAQHFVTRPFLDFVLHILPHLYEGRAVEEAATDFSDNSRSSAEVQIFKAIQLMQPEEVWQACERCIEAAARSTVAFDGISDRLIVSNIHGTAHS